MNPQSRWNHILIELAIVFLGVFSAYLITNWSERNRDRAFVRKMVKNLYQDIQTDTASINLAQFQLQQQYDSISLLIHHMRKNELSEADKYFHWTYESFITFYPTTQTFQSIIFSGDMKLLEGDEFLRKLKALAIANERVIKIQEYYRNSIVSFRNDFIVGYNIDAFHFSDIPQSERRRFWNSIKFHCSMIKGYNDVILEAKRAYEGVLMWMPEMEK